MLPENLTKILLVARRPCSTSGDEDDHGKEQVTRCSLV
jgi:hypothetical protein